MTHHKKVNKPIMTRHYLFLIFFITKSLRKRCKITTHHKKVNKRMTHHYLFPFFSASLRTPRPLGSRPFESEAVAARFRLFLEARIFRTQMTLPIQVQENLNIDKNASLLFRTKMKFSFQMQENLDI